MMRWITLLLAAAAALTLALAPGRALAQSGALLIAADEVFHGDLASFDQPIQVLGVVEGDVTSWSGAIRVEGEVRGDVVSYAGSIVLGPHAQVSGSVLSLGGGVSSTSAARVAGQVLGERPLAGGPLVADVASIFNRQPGAARADLPLPLISAALTLIGLLLTVACAALWPRRTLGVSRAISRAPAVSLAFGLLTTALLALLLLPLGGLIALSLIGLPLLLPLALLLQLPYLFGLAGLGWLVGGRLRPGDHEPAAAAAGVALLLLPLGVIGAMAPLVALALFYAVASAGLGAAILSRGGAYALRGRA